MKAHKYLVLMAAAVFLFSVFSVSGFAAKSIKQGKVYDTWLKEIAASKIDQPIVEGLAAKSGGTLRIDVELAFWCRDSETNVPPFVRLIELLNKIAKEKVTVNYFSCERKANKKVKYFVEEFKVERVPTFIFYRQNKEIGRIIENPKKSMLEDFLEIVF